MDVGITLLMLTINTPSNSDVTFVSPFVDISNSSIKPHQLHYKLGFPTTYPCHINK